MARLAVPYASAVSAIRICDAVMKIRVVDYVGSKGGGVRFTVQMLRALMLSGRNYQLELVSHGPALVHYRALLPRFGIECLYRDLPPLNAWGWNGFLGYVLSPEAVMDCDVAWFSWIHRHRIVLDPTRLVVGSFHDGLMFNEPALINIDPRAATQERETTRMWLQSPAVLAASSRFWIERLSQSFGVPTQRLTLIPISGDHEPADAVAEAPAPQLPDPYLLCPANVSVHKNHEVLIRGFAMAQIGWPLVLTGSDSDLVNNQPFWHRFKRRIAVALGLRPRLRPPQLNHLARELGLKRGANFFPLGYVEEPIYDLILKRAACLVMPTLGEGGGSFPVEEAVRRGIPVICSDIPVLQEHMTRIGADVLWFDPTDPAALAGRLSELKTHYPAIRELAQSQVVRLKPRSWRDVAAEYAVLFAPPA